MPNGLTPALPGDKTSVRQTTYVVGMDVQVFGIQNDADTRKALRFFKERRVKVHFMDFKQRLPSKGELRRFFDRFGEERLVDRGSKRFSALGLGAAYYGDERWLEIACDEPLILNMPLVRCGSRLTIGPDEASWKEWLAG
jgi:arsenate reductase